MKQGARVAVIDKDKTAGEILAATHGEKLFFFHGDVADESALSQFSQAVIQRFGKLDALVNNACLSRRGILSGCTFDDFVYVQKLVVAAPYFLTQQFLKIFSNNAAIVSIASTRAFMSQADTESYSAAKGGIVALTHALAASLAGRVRVNCVSPGWIDTGAHDLPEADKTQHPAGRVGTPMDIAKMVLFLCDDDAGFITGQNITIDGGMTKLMIYHGDNGWSYDVTSAKPPAY